ncbi:hypothetical protein AB1278_17605 [Chryseobacterium sp. NRRL B-14798]|uniref:hypothetical protein n=1 Tax=Chryseobacterium sp. NRRL B-14798 TaxID=3162880 RepID=UPI003D19715F
MKLHAIFQNGTRIQDFIDMHFLLEHNPLKIYLESYRNKILRQPCDGFIRYTERKEI